MDIEFSRQRALRTRDLPEKADPFTRKHPALAERYDEKAGGPLNASPMIDRPAPLAREWIVSMGARSGEV